MIIAKVFVLQKKFEGVPKNDDVKIVQEELPSIKDGEFLAQALFISVDPFIRAYTDKLSVGSQIIGIQLAKIIESKNSKFPIGKNVIGFFGWRTHTISDGTHKEKDKIPRLVDADLGNLSVSNTLGVLGRPGFSAYFGFLDICQPKQGDVVVVSGAAGAVGHLVGQIAKIKGCGKVIGIVGSDEKGRWLINDLGFDHFINYKTEQDINAVLKKLAPDGVDCYFDNVGGEISSTVIHNLKMRGRVTLCGAISQYNEKEVPMVPSTLFPIYTRRIRIEGFLCARFVDRWTEAFNQNLEWIKEGKLKTKERVTEGFENTFQAFVEMLNGKNLGKAVVKV